jgi:hypothetical protein
MWWVVKNSRSEEYVIHILKEKDRVTEEPALALSEEG